MQLRPPLGGLVRLAPGVVEGDQSVKRRDGRIGMDVHQPIAVSEDGIGLEKVQDTTPLRVLPWHLSLG